jgi:hypothetical protein
MTTSRVKEITDALHPLLKSVGFKRVRSTWNRAADPFIDVVNVQIAKSLVGVWVNLGVADPRAYELIWRAPPPRQFSEADAIARARLGELITGRDRWWELSDPGAGDEIANALESHGLPFFDGMHTYGAVERWLANEPGRYPPIKLGLAFAQHRQGKQQEACATLAMLGSPSSLGAWAPAVDEVAKALGCRSGRDHIDRDDPDASATVRQPG